MGCWPTRAFWAAFLLVVGLSVGQAHAQAQNPPGFNLPPPPPTPSIPMSDLSAGAAVADLGSSFLERLGDQASGGFNRASRSNPGGGGASESLEGQPFRTWGEAYGI